ncbi:hypothetical protein STANM309S_02958 [Streptomyces tanashiensis]
MEPTPRPKSKPIGFLLNRTDEALTRVMDGTLGEFGLTRVAWQVLNLAKGTAGPPTPRSCRSSRPTPTSPP